MPNIDKIITMTTVGSNSGPDYSVWYSNNCVDYTLLSGSASLPNVGSTIQISIPDTAMCVKLINVNGECQNELVKNIPGVTTTTTTTLQPTTTTTTIAPSTTTTTTVAPVYYVMTKCDGTGQYTYPLKDTNNSFHIGSIVKIGSAENICVTLTSVYVGTPFIFFTSNDGIDYASCNVCQGITTTTTSTTTTTTNPCQLPYSYTSQQVGWSSTSAGDACEKNRGFNFYADSNTFCNITQICGFELSYVAFTNFWMSDGTNSRQFTKTSSTTANAVSSCVSCVAPTTTTTSTTSTTTTTTVAPTKYRYVRYDIDPETCLTIDGPLPIWSYLNIASGFYYIESDPTKYYIQTSSHTDETFQFTSVTPFTCTPVTTTTTQAPITTTTTLAPATTTTTTTQAPQYTYWLADVYPCYNCGAGPTETGIGVAFDVNGPQPIINRFYNAASGSDGVSYKIIDNGTPSGYHYILGGPAYNTCAQACPGTTTTTTTTTTTQAPVTTTTTSGGGGTTTTTTAPTTLDWQYIHTGGATGTLVIYVNGIVIETRSTDSNGTWPLQLNDVVNVFITTGACNGANNIANAYTTGDFYNDSACGTSSCSLATFGYTVGSGDIGRTLLLTAFSTCDSACV